MNTATRTAATLGVVVALSAGGVAWAAGNSVPGTGSLVFYYGQSSGDGRGGDATGRTSWRQCLDAPGASQHVMFVSKLRENKAFQIDPTLQTTSSYYDWAEVRSGYKSTSTTGKYYPYVTWNYASSAPTYANGYGRITSC